MKPSLCVYWITTSISFYFLTTISAADAQSIQIDGTTPTTPGTCTGSCMIEGGLQYGNNLFHSFSHFNVDEGAVVVFQDPGVANIFSRVTGTNQSYILGTLGVVGNHANLFLMNPNGIIFGQNARLDVKGSFVATTANAIQFGDRGLFKASVEPISPLLTINPSALLFNQNANGAIANYSKTEVTPPYDLEAFPVETFGLQVPNSKNLLLVGGDVILDGGGVNAFSGRIELGGLAESGAVGLIFDGNKPNLSFPNNVARADVSVINGARVNALGNGSGTIVLYANDIDISGNPSPPELGGLFAGRVSESEVVNSQARDLTLNALGTVSVINNGRVGVYVLPGAEGNSGNINVNAGSLFLSGRSAIQVVSRGNGEIGDVNIDVRDGLVKLADRSGINSSLLPDAKGKDGNIFITAKEVSLTNSQLSTDTFGEGDAGNVFVQATENVSLSDSLIFSNVQEGAVGNGGDINIETRALSLTGGSEISASVIQANNGLPGGRGQGGNILINASDSINLSGFSESQGFSSGLSTATQEGAIGQAGNITVNTTGTFRIADGAIVNAQTLNQSEGGSITIKAATFEEVNGGQIITTSGSSGNAGSITVSADAITVSGSESSYAERVAEFGTIVQNESPGNSGIFASTRNNSTGTGGTIIFTAEDLTIRDGAQVSVSSLGAGNAGNINITANSIFLNGGNITGETRGNQAQEGANINLQVSDLLLLQNESLISATALGNANGGNINIDTKFLIALPIAGTNGNDIIANAVEGRGGNIQINTQGIFNIAERRADENNGTNDIDASSDSGIDGIVEINDPNVDPQQTLEELPENVVDVSRLIAQNLCRASRGSQFTVTGRGGLPDSPNEALRSDETWEDWRIAVQNSGVSLQESEDYEKLSNQPQKIVEAQGWVMNSQGKIILTAEPIVVNPRTPVLTSSGC